MVPAVSTPEYLTQLGVTMTQSSLVDPSIDVFQEFLAAKPTKQVEYLYEFKTAGFMYMSEHKEFVAASMVLKQRSRNYRDMWVIAQLGNTLALGPAPI